MTDHFDLSNAPSPGALALETMAHDSGALGQHGVRGAGVGPNDSAAGKDRPLESIESDSYTPTTESHVSGDYPAAVRGRGGGSEVQTCYCGSCEGCRLRHAQRRESEVDAAQEDRPREDEDRQAGELSEEEDRQVDELQRTDREVRAHEEAHVAAGARSAIYEYQLGPDGRAYAVGGSAQIEINVPSGDPAEKAAQAREMRAAALAPADPSPQDLTVAAKAARLEAEASLEMREAEEEKQEESFASLM